MRGFLKTKWGIVCIVAAVLLLLGGGAFGGYQYWLYQQPKFQDVTVELGTDTVHMRQFLTRYARLEKAAFVTDVSVIDLNNAGDTALVMRHGRKEETVTLHVVDTTPPSAVFHSRLSKAVGYVPVPQDFVESVTDLSETTVAFKEEPVLPEDYTDLALTVVVADVHGNAIEQVCTVSYSWMYENVTLELGQHLTAAHILMDPQKDAQLLDQAQLVAINGSGVGEYTVTCTSGGRTAECVVAVVDTTGPTLELEPVEVYVDGSAKLEDFVVKAEDLSGQVELKLLTELRFNKKGTYPVSVEAKDIHGNVTTAETTLEVITDTTAPSISGLGTLTVEKHSAPDFLKGVSAYDRKDGSCAVSCNADTVDLTRAGTYYATYTATDKSGNTASMKRKVVVNHDEEDTKALVASIAQQVGSDPEALRDYVRYNIAYLTVWGGDDPVWYGFTQWAGNCYVHALCLQALLDYYGYQTQLIWVEDQTHYWLQINLNGTWWHIDGTPGNTHTKYSLMNDEQRLETLKGRKWDTTKWPACG